MSEPTSPESRTDTKLYLPALMKPETAEWLDSHLSDLLARLSSSK